MQNQPQADDLLKKPMQEAFNFAKMVSSMQKGEDAIMVDLKWGE